MNYPTEVMTYTKLKKTITNMKNTKYRDPLDGRFIYPHAEINEKKLADKIELKYSTSLRMPYRKKHYYIDIMFEKRYIKNKFSNVMYFDFMKEVSAFIYKAQQNFISDKKNNSNLYSNENSMICEYDVTEIERCKYSFADPLEIHKFKTKHNA